MTTKEKIYEIPAILIRSFKNAALVAFDRKPRLEWLVFEVTDLCNSRCTHCNIWKTPPTKNPLTLVEIKKIFCDPLLKNLKSVLITGGECSLRPDLKEIILEIHKVLPKTTLFLSTNALLPERILEAIKFGLKNKVRLGVGISLDAAGQKHDQIRGVAGNFKKADYLLRELKKLKEKNKNLNVVIGHTLSPLTLVTLDKITKYAKKLGLESITQLYEEFVFYHNLGTFKKTNHTEALGAIRKLPPSFHNEVLLAALNKKLSYKCFSMNSFFFLHCNGNVSPCLRYSDVIVGNIRHSSLKQVWNNLQSQKARKLVSSCSGCANTWATNWSFESYFPPFLNVVLNLSLDMVKKLLGLKIK